MTHLYKRVYKYLLSEHKHDFDDFEVMTIVCKNIDYHIIKHLDSILGIQNFIGNENTKEHNIQV